MRITTKKRFPWPAKVSEISELTGQGGLNKDDDCL